MHGKNENTLTLKFHSILNSIFHVNGFFFYFIVSFSWKMHELITKKNIKKNNNRQKKKAWKYGKEN